METIKRSDKPTLHSLVVVEKGYGLKGIGNVVGCRRYSSKTKLFRVAAYVLRFIAKIKKRTANNMSELSADELFEAEEKWIRDVQSDEFPTEVQQLTTGTKASSSRLNQLRFILDDKGIVRSEGRIEHSVVSSGAKRTILLPAQASCYRFNNRRKLVLLNHTRMKGTLNRALVRYIGYPTEDN